MSDTVEPTLDAAVAAAADSTTRVVVPTDADDEALDRARRVATALARRHGWEIVLYDRSDERWTDTPHPTGPHTVGEIEGTEREHLVRQMRDIESADVEVTAWLATVPSLTAMIDVLQQISVDGVVVPTEQDDPKIMDRLLDGSSPAALVDRVAELQLDLNPTFFVVADDGSVSLGDSEVAA